jgi:hypothetical protein
MFVFTIKHGIHLWPLSNRVNMFYLRLILISLVTYGSMIALAFSDNFHEPDSQVWKVGQRRWTIQEEYNYSKWIETNITEDFFIRHEIRVDCADAPYAIRWIYARINHLPGAAMTINNRLIGHWSRDWAHLQTDTRWDKDQRFRAALMSMLSLTSTGTLPSDTYPIRIAEDSVTAGAVFLIAEGHAGIVSNIVMDGSTTHPIQTLEAGSPKRIQRFQRRDFISPNLRGDHISGLLRFRWPVNTGNQWHYLPIKEHPFYSEEQYSPAFTEGYFDYLEAVEKRIDPKDYDPNEKAEKIMATLVRQLNERIPIVLDGNKKCHIFRCPDGSLLRDIFSTPDRDEIIRVMLSHLEKIIRTNHLDREAFLDKLAKIQLQISPDRFITLQYVFENAKWMSSKPEATIENRWGLDKCRIIAGHLKSAQESIAFIQNKYSKTDPLFAERSIWTQQSIVDNMIVESQKNNCATISHNN